MIGRLFRTVLLSEPELGTSFALRQNRFEGRRV